MRRRVRVGGAAGRGRGAGVGLGSAVARAPLALRGPGFKLRRHWHRRLPAALRVAGPGPPGSSRDSDSAPWQRMLTVLGHVLG
jgi:hypothetical protein